MNHAVLKPRPSPLHWVSSAPDELGSSCDRSNLKHCPVMLTLYTSGHKARKKLCSKVVEWFYANYLIEYDTTIEVLHRGLIREGAYGYCDVVDDEYTEYLIEIHNKLSKEDYVKYLIHELVHIHQFCTGSLEIKSCKRYFKGVCMDELDYENQDHEIEAHKRERVLYEELLEDYPSILS